METKRTKRAYPPLLKNKTDRENLRKEIDKRRRALLGLKLTSSPGPRRGVARR